MTDPIGFLKRMDSFLITPRTDFALMGGTSVFFGLFNNLAVFIIMVTAYGILDEWLERRGRLWRQAVVGAVFGLFIYICMHVRIPVAEGVIVDQRNAIVILAGFFGGPLSAVISAAIGAAYRAYLGGAGIYGGALGLSLAAIAGTMLKALRPKIEAPWKLALCSIAATIFVLPGFLPIGSFEAGWKLLKAMALPYGSAIFVGVFLGSLLLANEERRRDAGRELRESESRYRGLFQNMMDISYRADGMGKLTIVSPSCEEMLGYRPDEMLGRPFTDFYRDPSKRAVLLEALEHEGSVKNFELDLVKKDGTVATVWTNAKWTVDSGGLPFGVDGVLRDVTQAKKDAEEKRSLEESLRQSQKMQAIGQLAGGIAHDFNNMLSVIIGFTEITLQDIPPGDPAAQSLAQVLGAGERARRLVSQILTFSRGGSVEKSAIRLRSIVKEVLGFLKMTIPSSVTISADLREESGAVIADVTQIHEAVMNLASNAVHAMSGKGVLSVRLSEECFAAAIRGRIGAIGPGVFSVIEVQDTGVGMEKALVDKAFEPFFTTKPVGEGTGMGLSVVYGIMRDHGGDIVVESAPGKGTSMKLYFPRIDVELADEAGAGSDVPGGTERVLFVDDEAVIADLTERLLAALGYKVTAMTDPTAALKLLATDPFAFDLLITDQNMPLMTGIELAKKAIALNAALPVILCTGYSSPVDEQEAIAAGVRKLSMKPIRKRELGQIIRRVLEGPAP